MLESLGISTAAEAVYRTMLRHREWGARRIATELDLTEEQVRDALDELSGLALLRPAIDAEGLHPISPAIGLAALLAQAEAEVSSRQRQIESTRAVVAAMTSEHELSLARDSITRLDSADAVRDRVAELTGSAVRECLSLNPNDSYAGYPGGPLGEQVRVSCVFQDSYRNDPALLDHVRRLPTEGARVRTAPVLPLFMAIYDRRTVLLEGDPGAVEISSPGVVALACALFDQIWDDASLLDGPVTRDEAGLDAVERKLLSLLADGLTDQMVARRLGVSISTVRRMMAGLMDRLDARSRFQAGMQTAQRGWLGGDPSSGGQRQGRKLS